MDYKKRCEELVEAIKQLQEINPSDEGIQNWANDVLYETKEVENEKIRKALIAFIKKRDRSGCDYDYDKWIAWLEKQGEIDKASYEIAEKEKREFVGDGFIKCYAGFQDFKEGETYWLEYIGNDNYNVRSDNLLGKTYHITPCQLYTIFKKQTWLEKQGQKFQYWKPSEEQLEALDYAYNSCPDTERGNYYEGVLETIIDDLHKFSEKQGETSPILSNSLNIGKSEISGNEVKISPKWTDEDEVNWSGIIDEIEANKSEAPDYDFETYDRFLSWLDNIKQRLGGEE